MTAPARWGVASCLALALLLVACTPSSDTTATSTTTTPPAGESPTTTVPLLVQPFPGPSEERVAAVASVALEEVDGFSESSVEGVWETDVVESIVRWFPEDELVESAFAVYERGDDRVVVVSLIPTMSWRGDPTLVRALAGLDSRSDPDPIAEGIYRAFLPGGVVADLWSTGDGALAAVSLDETAQTEYLSLREEAREPLPVWPAGTCLDVPDDGGLPWAPFPRDAIVPCTEPHNAEVIASNQVGTDLDTYDEQAIAFQRNYDCDEAYEEVFGPQRDARPTLITYMPDGDEWDRGDRYLACVVQLEGSNGSITMSSPMAERDDLAWSPEVGDCYTTLGSDGPVDCDAAHTFELVGTVEFADDDWPESSSAALRESCAPLLADLEPGAADILAFPSGLYPYAFEHGEREIRCFGVAVTPDGIADVLGSFHSTWSVLGSDGIAA